MSDYYSTGITLTQIEKKIVDAEVERRGLGSRGFSPALRMIIREWEAARTRHIIVNTTSVPASTVREGCAAPENI